MKQQKTFWIGTLLVSINLVATPLLRVIQSIVNGYSLSVGSTLFSGVLGMIPTVLLAVAFLLPAEQRTHHYLFAGSMFLSTLFSGISMISALVNYIRYGVPVTLYIAAVFSLLFAASRVWIGIDALLLKFRLKVISLILLGANALYILISMVVNFFGTVEYIFEGEIWPVINLLFSVLSLLPIVAITLYLLLAAKPAAPKMPAVDPRLVLLQQSFEAGNMTQQEYNIQKNYILSTTRK